MLVYSQDDKSFWKYLTKSSGTFIKIYMITIQGSTWIEESLIPPAYFVLNSESSFANISTTGSLTDANMNLLGESNNFLTVGMLNFLWNNNLH